MVFPSMPVYLDPPNWQQQPNQHQGNGIDNHLLLPPLLPQCQTSHGRGGAGSVRLGSMENRAQQAKIAPPEVALKCPRCESTNTKFCYFNNYSLSQPRHFCKTCRRYWTKGGSLRNVPVGGGCRRNKKNKRSRSKSPASTEKQTLNSNSTSANIPSELIDQFQQPITSPSFVASLQNLSRYGVGNIGLSLREIQGQTTHLMGFQVGGSNNNNNNNSTAGGGVDQWRLQQFPFLNGFESTNSAVSPYPFQSESIGGTQQLPPVKSEDKQYYSWTDLSGLAPSTSNLL